MVLTEEVLGRLIDHVGKEKHQGVEKERFAASDRNTMNIAIGRIDGPRRRVDVAFLSGRVDSALNVRPASERR